MTCRRHRRYRRNSTLGRRRARDSRGLPSGPNVSLEALESVVIAVTANRGAHARALLHNSAIHDLHVQQLNMYVRR